MLRKQPLVGSGRRRGVILLVVLALLTLFALVGLIFVLYAQAEAEASRHYREAFTLRRPDMNPEVLLQYFLEQLVYDVPDSEAGVYSGLRGYSLARSMYGYNDAVRNDVPFHGTGRLHYPSVFESRAFQDLPPQARDDYYLINYTYFAGGPDDQSFVRDPERLGARPNLTAPRGPFTGGADAPYTYPDLNSLFLAAVKFDGTVLMPSFHRPWLFGSNDPVENPNWTNEVGKYLLLRPRPIDMGPGFPYPEDPGGDVKNLICTPGGNDSYWLDLDAPVMTAWDGRLYKPLFAPLVLDLENLLNVPQPPGPKPRWQRPLTMAAYDRDRPAVAPWVWDSAAKPYVLKPGDLWPVGKAIPFPPLSARPASPTFSEFDADWQAADAVLGRIELNRPLSPYPSPDPQTGRITDLDAFRRAEADRVGLARDIYDRLRRVTGAAEPAVAAARAAVGDPQQFNALRWLAQLAVNMVDYLDPDDYSTPFNWYTNAQGEPQWVVGTELPRLVLNEVYAEIANDPTDRQLPKRASKPFQVNFWVELLNPTTPNPALTDGGGARLEMPDAGELAGYPIYRVLVARTPNPGLRSPDRVLGDPDPGNTLLVVSDYSPAPPPAPQPLDGVDMTLVQPVGSAYAGPVGGNAGFYVLGPVVDFPGTRASRPAATLRVREQFIDGARSALSYPLPNTTPLPGQAPPAPGHLLVPQLPQHALLLQRLACPALPPNPDPVSGLDPGQPFNPYVTIDYLDSVQTNDGVIADHKGPRRPTPVTERHSYGRNQPYAADALQQRPQAPQPPLAAQPQHTFFRQNAVEALPPPTPGPGQTLRIPFDWLVHLDRPLLSPVELLQGSAFKPHELTQQFYTAAGPFQHTARWFDQDVRLWRGLEFLVTNHAPGPPPPGGRVSGKINLNTLWDPWPFLAVCDPQPADNFTLADLYLPLGDGAGHDHPADPQTIYWRMLLTRTPQMLAGGGPGAQDRPFRSLADAHTAPGDEQYPLGIGLQDTLLRSFEGTGPRRLLQPPLPPPGDPNRHPYRQMQLLNKIFNRLETRSSLFGVWLTVGFFEVTDAAARPVKLGAELNRAQNTHIRHRMFAVVDRSVLKFNRGPQPLFQLRRPPDPGLLPYFAVID